MNEIGKKLLASITALTIGIAINSVDVEALKLNEGNIYTGATAYAEEIENEITYDQMTPEQQKQMNIQGRKDAEYWYDQEYSEMGPFDEMATDTFYEFTGADFAILNFYDGEIITKYAKGEDVDYDVDFVCLDIGKYFSDPASSAVLSYFATLKNEAMIEFFDNDNYSVASEINNKLLQDYISFTSGEPLVINDQTYTINDINGRAQLALMDIGLGVIASLDNQEKSDEAWDKYTRFEEELFNKENNSTYIIK